MDHIGIDVHKRESSALSQSMAPGLWSGHAVGLRNTWERVRSVLVFGECAGTPYDIRGGAIVGHVHPTTACSPAIRMSRPRPDRCGPLCLMTVPPAVS